MQQFWCSVVKSCQNQSKLKFDHNLIYSTSILRFELVGMEPTMKFLTWTIKKLRVFLFIFTMVHEILAEGPPKIDCFLKYFTEKVFYPN